MSLWWSVRKAGRFAARYLRPGPAESAHRRLEALAARTRRYVPGRVRVAGLDLEYTDATTLALQWKEWFVRPQPPFAAGDASPRILDCGANIGLATIALKQAYPGARVTAFEADPDLAAVLARNLARNGCADVEVVPAAVWREAGTVAFRREGADAGAIDTPGARAAGPLVEVPAVRLRDRVGEGPVDLLKLDIEGAELDVLLDLEPVLDRVRAIQVEVHDFDPGRRLLPDVLQLLARGGYVYALSECLMVTWRDFGRPAGPFAPVVPHWIVMVRAWRDGGGR